MLKTIRNSIPLTWKSKVLRFGRRMGLKQQCKDDYQRFKKHSLGLGDPIAFNQLNALILKNSHSLEKGLSFRNFRPGFGRDKINILCDLLQELIENHTKDCFCFRVAVSCLWAYVDRHESLGYDVLDIREKIILFSEPNEYKLKGGVMNFTKEELLETATGDFKTIAESRHSIRDFSTDPVDVDTIIEAISIATKTPSACNRQAWYVKVIKDEKMKELLRNNQNGNKGFGDKVDTFLVVTADMGAFYSPRELNQAFIDGGMFSMSLLYSLHYKGLAACTLSASLHKTQEQRLRKAFAIPNSHVFVCMIAIGHYRPEFKVPRSPRRDAMEFTEIIK